MTSKKFETVTHTLRSLITHSLEKPLWIHSSNDKPLPRDAVRVGDFIHSAIVYIGRTVFEGELLPTSIVPGKRSASLAWRGKEHKVQHYEVLVGNGFKWLSNCNDLVPEGAIAAGITISDEQLYFGRCHYMNTMCLGRVQPSEECIYFAFEGEELRMLTYEYLIADKPDNWVATSFQHTPVDAVVAGYDTDDSVIYVGRIMIAGLWHPAKIIPNKTCAYCCIEGLEVYSSEFEILCGDADYDWQQVEDHIIPKNAVETGCCEFGMPFYVGRGKFRGSLTPGVISLQNKCLLLPYGGRAISVENYEVLVKK